MWQRPDLSKNVARFVQKRSQIFIFACHTVKKIAHLTFTHTHVYLAAIQFAHNCVMVSPKQPLYCMHSRTGRKIQPKKIGELFFYKSRIYFAEEPSVLCRLVAAWLRAQHAAVGGGARADERGAQRPPRPRARPAAAPPLLRGRPGGPTMLSRPRGSWEGETWDGNGMDTHGRMCTPHFWHIYTSNPFFFTAIERRAFFFII